MNRLEKIRQAEKASHEEAYGTYALFEKGSWLAKPVKTVLDILPLLKDRADLRTLDLGCGVGRNSIPVAQAFPGGRVDCVDILPSAVEKLKENAKEYGVEGAIRGIVSGIDEFAVTPDGYDLILAISALEHMDSEETMGRKLEEICRGIRAGGIVCLVMNSGVRERDKATGCRLEPQFEVDLPTDVLQTLLRQTFTGWEILKSTIVHQKYDIPRSGGMAELESDVVTLAAQKKA